LFDLDPPLTKVGQLQLAAYLLIEREKRTRLARELAKLDRAAEQKMADEGLADESWPEY
jgi:hypothetical protein